MRKIQNDTNSCAKEIRQATKGVTALARLKNKSVKESADQIVFTRDVPNARLIEHWNPREQSLLR